MGEPTTLEAPIQPPTAARKGRIGWFAFLLAVANLIWAGQLTAVKYINLDPLAVAFLPFLFITPLLLPLLIWNRHRKPDAPKPSVPDWMRFIVAGVAGQILAQLGMSWGPIKGQASSCSILYLLIPVMTAVLASIILRERVTLLRVVCLGIGLLGVLLMSWQDVQNSSFLQSNFITGNLLMLAGCLGASFYNVYCKGLMQKFHERDILIYSYITATPAGLAVLVWLRPECFSQLMHLNWQGWVAFAFNTLLVYGISMIMLFYVLQFLPVTVVLASTYLVPVFGVVIAMFMLGERLTMFTMIGAAVVLASTLLIMKYDAAEAAP